MAAITRERMQFLINAFTQYEDILKLIRSRASVALDNPEKARSLISDILIDTNYYIEPELLKAIMAEKTWLEVTEAQARRRQSRAVRHNLRVTSAEAVFKGESFSKGGAKLEPTRRGDVFQVPVGHEVYELRQRLIRGEDLTEEELEKLSISLDPSQNVSDDEEPIL